jgi:hypothetical protein
MQAQQALAVAQKAMPSDWASVIGAAIYPAPQLARRGLGG